MLQTKSKSGYTINVCCASCVHKILDDKQGPATQAVRLCGLTGEQVNARMCCTNQVVRPELLEL